MNWSVDDGYTHSDYRANRYSVIYGKQRALVFKSKQPRCWQTIRNGKVFTEALRSERKTLDKDGEELVAVVSRVCDDFIPRKGLPKLTGRQCICSANQLQSDLPSG